MKGARWVSVCLGEEGGEAGLSEENAVMPYEVRKVGLGLYGGEEGKRLGSGATSWEGGGQGRLSDLGMISVIALRVRAVSMLLSPPPSPLPQGYQY